jgi:hypothetical protein
VVTFTVDHDLEVGLVVYPTKDAAYDAARKHGGIVLPVDSADLKNLFTPQEFTIDDVKQLHRSAILREGDDCDGDCAIFVENSISVDYSSLPHKLVPEIVNDGDDQERTIQVTEFGPEADAWFATLEVELGAFVHVE